MVEKPYLWFTYWVILIVSFSLIGFLLVSKAIGYRYNPLIKRFQRTSMLVVSNAPKDSELIFDGVRHVLRPTTRVPNVLPGVYRVRIQKAGYNPWEKTVNLQPGLVSNLSDIALFREQPIEVADPKPYLDLLPYYQPDDRATVRANGELWVGTQFVSRFSQPPGAVILLPSGKQIIYLRGNELRMIETNGERDELLYTRTTSQSQPFAYINDAVILADGETLKVLKIQ